MLPQCRVKAREHTPTDAAESAKAAEPYKMQQACETDLYNYGITCKGQSNKNSY